MEAMDSDPDFIVFKLRSEMFELVGDLRKLEFEGVDEFTRFLERTRDAQAQTQIPKLQAMKDHMQLLKTRIIEKSRASSFAPLRGDTRHMPSSSPATAKPRLLSSAPSPMGSAPLQGDKPSSWPAKELEVLPGSELCPGYTLSPRKCGDMLRLSLKWQCSRYPHGFGDQALTR